MPRSRDRPGLLRGTTAFITGSARGIGLEVADRFLAEGAAVTIADLDGDAARVAAAGLVAAGRDADRICWTPVDVCDPTSVAAAADAAEDALGPTTCLVANAGTLHLAPVVDLDIETWRRVVDVNLTGAFVTAKELSRRLVARGKGGRVIFTSSLYGLRGGARNGAYSASKFGVIGLMESLAAELASADITVNAVCPGQVRTTMIDDLVDDQARREGRDRGQVLADMCGQIPLGRLATPREVADTFVFLASDMSAYTTGRSLVVDGGMQVG